jgi:chromate transport protein ChrA
LLRTIIPAYLLSSMCFINILNLYFASGFITYITNTEGRILPTLIAMVLCVALFFIQNLEDLLSPLVASIASIITIIVTKFTIKQYQDSNEFRRDNMISLLISLVILFLCKMGWIKITGILFFDAVIVALIFSIHTYKIVRSKK